MKIIITESQYRRLIEQEEPEVLHIPSLKYFNNDWNSLQEYLESEGNPPYTIDDNLDLRRTEIQSLGNLTSVDGDLDLFGTDIKSLGNLQSVGGDLDLRYSEIESLGNLQSVGGDLDLSSSKIESLGNLQSVGGDLYLSDTPLSEKYSEEEIREMVQVGGNIYMQ
jgi:hypothetical protein